MNMTFKEKSAWGSLLALGLVSWWFFPAAFDVAASTGNPARLVGLSIGCVVALIIIEAIYHLIITATGGTSTDERDALINLKAERIAGVVLGIALFSLVGRIIAVEALEWVETMGALTIAVWILFALMASEISKLASQVWYYRTNS